MEFMAAQSPPTSVEAALTEAVSRKSLPFDDLSFATSLVERVAKGDGLTTRQRKAAHAMLGRAGYDISNVAVPEEVRTQQAELAKQLISKGVRFTVEDARIAVRTPYAYKDICKSIASRRWSPSAKAWTYPISATVAADIVAAFARVPGDIVEWDDAFQELIDTHEKAGQAQVLKSAQDLPPIPQSTYDGWLHQRQAYHFAKDLPAAMLAMDMGTGKSKVAVDLLTNNGAKVALIQCPVSVLGVWPREFRKHAGKDWSVVVLNGPIKTRVAQAEAAIKESVIRDKPLALVTNYEGAVLEPFKAWSLARSWDYLILDESHRAKAPNGVRSKYLGQLGKVAKRVLCLTGTPMPHSPLDVWAQFRTLDPHIFGPSFHRFSHRYAEFGGWEDRQFQRMDPLMADEFEAKLSSITYRVSADVLDLPPDRDVERSAVLSPKAKKLYDKVENELYATLEESGGTVSIDNILVKLLRLQQITGGAINDDDGNTTTVDESKAKLLADILEDISPNDPVVVFCRFTHDLRVVKEAATLLDRNYGELSGQRKDLTDDAEMPEWCQVMGVQIAAGGVGIDLTRAKYGIYYSLGYSLGDYQQSRARLVRPGQESEVLFIHLTCAGTIDEKVYDALAQRESVVKAVLGKIDNTEDART